VDLDLERLLDLPAAERLELADILRRSVGCPRDAEAPDLPGWELARQARILRRASLGPPDPDGPPAG
jgi:hypothetical protein